MNVQATSVETPRKAVAAHNVAAFGAVGDGVANDTPALSAALAAAAADGLPVYLPPGTYVTDPLTVAAGVEVQGCGPRAELLRRSPGSAPLVSVAGSYATVRDLTISGGSSAPQPGGGTGLAVTSGAVHAQVVRCLVRRCSGWGLDVQGSQTSVRGSTVEATNNGVRLLGLANLLSGSAISPAAGTAVQTWATTAALITGNQVSVPSGGFGIVVSGGADTVVAQNVVVGSAGSVSGILLNGGATAVALHGNHVRGVAAAGINVVAASSCAFTTNTVADCGGAGIIAQAPSSALVIDGNLVTGCGGPGISLANAADLVLTANTCLGNGRSGGSGAAGIALGGLHDAVVAHNVCSTGSAGPQPVGIAVTGQLERVVLDQNQVAGNAGSGITATPGQLVGGSTSTPLRKLSAVVTAAPTAVPHGLGYTPNAVVVSPTSDGTIWRCAPSDQTNVYLQADVAGRRCDLWVG